MIMRDRGVSIRCMHANHQVTDDDHHRDFASFNSSHIQLKS